MRKHNTIMNIMLNDNKKGIHKGDKIHIQGHVITPHILRKIKKSINRNP
jgi:hypothetical protein